MGCPKIKRNQFTEKQTITTLKEYEAGIRVQELVSQHNVSEQLIDRWTSKFSDMEVFDARKLRWAENRQLKKLVANLHLNKNLSKCIIIINFGKLACLCVKLINKNNKQNFH